MQKTDRFLTTVISTLLIFCISCERNNENHALLGESCLSLSSTIAQAPGADAGEAEYEPYAGLEVPPLPPEQALKTFNLPQGFRIEVVAHEPMITSPVAMDIDADGRLWVVDMPSYMPGDDMDVLQDAMETMERERVPRGRVTVLEDTNGDGKMDTHRVFADSLILPRAIKVLHDGVLVGEPPNHAFSVRSQDGEIPDGYRDWPEFVPEILGQENLGYGPVEDGTAVAVAPGAASHSILEGFEPVQWQSTGNMYLIKLLDDKAKVLLTGMAGENVNPVAYIRKAGENRIFYTSLGYPDDFKELRYRNLLVNAIRWTLN